MSDASEWPSFRQWQMGCLPEPHRSVCIRNWFGHDLYRTTRTVRFALMPALRSLAAAAQRAADAFGLLPAAYSTTDHPPPPRSEPA